MEISHHNMKDGYIINESTPYSTAEGFIQDDKEGQKTRERQKDRNRKEIKS